MTMTETEISSTKGTLSLAIDGGPRAVQGRTGKPQPKVGIEEFFALAKRFGLDDDAMARLSASIRASDFGNGPNLARYYGPSDAAGPAMEAQARQMFGVKHAMAVSSGTGALHAAMVAIGIGPGDEVICPAIGFIATSIAVAMAGGVPVYCDVDASLQISPAAFEAAITPRTRAVAPTHHWSYVADMDAITSIARRHNLRVIEDCAQTPGGSFRGRPIGTIGDIGCFSISAYKIIGGSEGGMLLTNDTAFYERALQLAECGGLWRPDRFAPPRHPGELFAGTNYRLSELEATVIRVQLEKLPGVVQRYRTNSTRLLSQLLCFREIQPQMHNDPHGDIGYMQRFYPETHELSIKIASALRAEGVACDTRGINPSPDWHLASDMYPITLRGAHVAGASPTSHPDYLARGGQVDYSPSHWPVAHDLYSRAVRMDVDQWWSPEDIDAVAAAINKVLLAYCTPLPGKIGWI
jgi:dTDP-4-amino-4,6-dideoxygalactose transaminase